MFGNKKFWFKHESWGKEWQECPGLHYDAEEAAYTIAENDYNDDPKEPWKFRFSVDIKGEDGEEEHFEIIAEADIRFYAN